MLELLETILYAARAERYDKLDALAPKVFYGREGDAILSFTIMTEENFSIMIRATPVIDCRCKNWSDATLKYGYKEDEFFLESLKREIHFSYEEYLLAQKISEVLKRLAYK
mgnify:CR=1 FL=1